MLQNCIDTIMEADEYNKIFSYLNDGTYIKGKKLNNMMMKIKSMYLF
jgi:hypothetical protein